MDPAHGEREPEAPGVARTLEVFVREKASAILRTDDREAAARAMEAAVRGGFKLVEFTLTTPGAVELIREFSSREELTVGAGTVLTRAQAREAVAAGASFLVSPVTCEDVIAEARDLEVAAMPGGATPTELLDGHWAGAPLQKLFPAPGIGPDWVRACLGPLPFLRIVPTNGVDAGNAGRWLEAGAFAVGFVGSLFQAEVMAVGDWERIEEHARACLAAVREARPRSDGG